MENLQNWGFMGDIRINSGFYWGSNTGICCAILEGEGVAAVGVRAADWPRSEAQKVTLPRLKFEQAVIYPDGPSSATGEG